MPPFVRSLRAGRAPALLVVLAVTLAARAAAQTAISLSAVEGYGNLHAAGVVATVAGDAEGNAAAALEWRRSGEPAFRPGHPLLRTGATRFVGSLFFLEPATSYEVRVTLSDPNGVTGAPSLVASFATRSATLVEPSQRTLYVAPGGSNGNPGTDPLFPLATIQRAADLAQPGDLVRIAPGVYRESVTVPTSGTAAAPIVFRGEGPGAILDGADAAIAAGVSWTNDGGGVYSRATGFATGHVVCELGRLFRYGSLAELATLGAGAPGGFYFDGTRLAVHFSDGSAPSAHTLHVARLENGFYLDGRTQVRIEGVEIRHYGSGDYGKGVYLRYSTDCAVLRCDIHDVEAAGIWVKGGERHRLEENAIADSSVFDWPWDWTKGSSAEATGIYFTDAVGRGHVVRGNRLRGLFNGIAPCGSALAAGVATLEVDVYGNDLAEHADDAFEPEGECPNVRFWDNRIRDVHMAFAVAPAGTGPLWIVGNVAHDFGNTRTSQIDGYTASWLKVNSGYSTPVGPLLVYQNTFLSEAPGTSATALLNPGNSTFVRSRNNVMAGTDYALYKVNPIALDWDRDDLVTTHGSHFVWWQGTSYANLAALAAGTGQEAHGISAPPRLVSPAAGIYRPQATSPLRDAGLAIAGINDGYEGAAPDLGAVEWRSAIFGDGFEVGSAGAWHRPEPVVDSPPAD